MQWLLSATLYMIISFIFTPLACANPTHSTDEIFINCGSTGAAIGPHSRRWLGDKHPNFTIHGSSTKSSLAEELVVSGYPVPYKTARISRSQFSYVFRLDSGQKLIRLHFSPASYNGFRKSRDLFTVEAGPFTLLSNFSASITAEALAVRFFTKEFCIVTEKNRAFSVTFSPTIVSGQLYDTHAFINAIEIVSLPETFPYCHTGGTGVQVVGKSYLVYVDNSTALEMVHRQSVKRNSVSLRDDFRGDMFGMWAGGLSQQGNDKNNSTWQVSVDVGFRYLVRLYFCEVGLKMAANANTSFIIVINHMVACTNTDVVGKMEDRNGLFYRNYMVMVKGRKLEGKRDITISLQSEGDFLYGHVPIEGFEIFKLSNHDNSLASPNPLPPARDPTCWIFHDLFSVLGHRDRIASVVVIAICFVNIIVHKLRQAWESNFPEEGKKPTTKVSQTYRCFSLREIQAATDNFNDGYIIGKGGFGKVYKGFIDDGPKIVAIKRLKPDSKQGKREFWTEVETLSELRHVNLVSLIGYCNEQLEMILVYEYMPNGTLADHLYKLARKKSNYYMLSWEERLKICIGAGRGLDYLHTGKGVVHRDVKASNILLDESFVAKVSDFGLAKTEGFGVLQNQDSTNLKGTFGYIDPDYFRSRKLTMKSDTYAFGVVLLEVLCGRPAVDPLAGEDARSLTIWARDNISRGEFDQIIAPSLSGDISPYSLQAFLGVVERCLHDEPNKRPSIARVVINLEIALEQQNAKSLVPNAMASLADFFPFTDRTQQEYSKLLVTTEMTNVADILQNGDKIRLENTTPLMPNERIGNPDVWQRAYRTSMSTMQLTMPSSSLQNMSPTEEQSNSRILNTGLLYRKKDGRKSLMRKLSRLLPWDSGRKTTKPSTRTEIAGISISAPLSKHTSNPTPSKFSSIYQNNKPPTKHENDDLNSTSNLRAFSFLELKAATRNFQDDTLLGEGGFGRVYKGFLKENSTNKNATGSIIAIKRLNPHGFQGLKEWLSEISFLGKLSHPNLVKLLGYCVENEELILVYEYMSKGSLESQIFRKNSTSQTIQWDIRLKILIGAARGLRYLHTASVIYRDFKTSNILLGESYDAKLSDFGLAKSGPLGDHSHVSTRVVGTYGYASPEYMATGHLTTKSDVYAFGVVLLEMVTGLRVVDNNRPSGQEFLVEWIRPCFRNKKKLMGFIDSRLEGSYSPKSVLQVFQLAKNCLEAEPKVRPPMQEVVEILEAAEKLPRELRVRFNYPLGLASPVQ